MTINIIIVDDHAIIREGLKMILEGHSNIKVVGTAADGYEALTVARKLKPDVVVMDISMPNLNGIETTRRIKEELPETRIVILSMHSTPEDIYRAMKAGAIAYLLKESAGSEVDDAVNAAFSNRRYLSRKVDDILIDNYIFENQIQKSKGPLDSLSSREREVLQLIVEGKANVEIAGMLYLSVKTIETYRSRLMQKLGIGDIPALVRFAQQYGITK